MFAVVSARSKDGSAGREGEIIHVEGGGIDAQGFNFVSTVYCSSTAQLKSDAPLRQKGSLLLVLLTGWWSSAHSAADIEICVRRNGSNLFGFNEAFSKGAITVPVGTVFKWAGHTFGGAADPLDETHELKYPAMGWRGISKAASESRMRVMAEDVEKQKEAISAVVTLASVTLTRTQSCAAAPVAAAFSDELRWTGAPVIGDPAIYYQTYGIVRDGVLDTNWLRQTPSFGSAAVTGAMNGVVRGRTERKVKVRQ